MMGLSPLVLFFNINAYALLPLVSELLQVLPWTHSSERIKDNFVEHSNGFVC